MYEKRTKEWKRARKITNKVVGAICLERGSSGGETGL